MATRWRSARRAVQTGVLWPYLRSPAVFKCPADLGPFTLGTTHAMTSFLMNGAVCGFTGTRATLPSSKVHRFRTDAVVFWEADAARGSAQFNDGSNFPSEGMSSRHANGGDVAVIDGHVDRMPAATFARLLNVSPGPLWCNPASANGH